MIKLRRIKLVDDIFRNPFSYLLIAPAIFYVLIYGYATLPYVYIAFVKFDFRNIFASEFIGLKNFEFFFKSQSVITVSWNTIKFNLLNIGFGTTFSLLLAILFNEIKSKKFVRLSQTVLIFPYFVSWVAVQFLAVNLFSTTHGLINVTLESLGMETVRWYSTAKLWTWIIPGINLWKGAGMGAVIYLAAIAGIDQQIYEAAKIDGAGRLQSIMHITLPSLMPTVSILILLGLGRIFYGNFGMMYALIGDNGVLYKTTDIIDTYVFRALRKTGNPSTAMAVGLFQSIVGFITVFGCNRLAKKIFPEGAIF